MKIILNLVKYFFLYLFKRQSFGMYIKNVVENMSIAYIKLAQILSTRTDLLSKQSINDLKLINDECKVLPYSKINKILQKEYGERLNEIFKSIDKTPIGSASISQVHKAILTTGEEVVIKIKRLDVVENVEKDINFMNNFLKFFSYFSKKVRYLYNSNALESYFNWIKSETDFNNERENINKIYNQFNLLNRSNNLSNCKKMVSVKCYDKFCTENVIVMEYVKYNTLNKINFENEDTIVIFNAINSALRLYFFALLEYDTIYFHGDPHPGNVYVDNKGNLGFLDYGLIFEFTSDEIEMIKKLAICIYTKDIKGLYNLLMKLTKKYGYTLKERKKELKLKKDLIIYFNKLDDLNVTNWFMQMAFICIDNNLYVPEYYYAFAKSFVAMDGILDAIINDISGSQLLQEQFKKYIVQEKIKKVIKEIKNTKNYFNMSDLYDLLKEK